MFPYSGSLANLEVSVRGTGWVTVATEETDHSHDDELVTGHGRTVDSVQ